MISEEKIVSTWMDLRRENLPMYVQTRRSLEVAMAGLSYQEPSAVWISSWSDATKLLDECAQVSRPAARAVMLDAMVSRDCWMYRNGEQVNIAKLIPQPLMGDFEKVGTWLADVTPRTTSGGVRIDLSVMAEDYAREINSPVKGHSKEIQVVLGLNGSGKSTAIKGLEQFIKLLGLKDWGTFHFPRKDGPFGEQISKVLAGTQELAGGALQWLMFADLMDALAGLDIPQLSICDRFAPLDAPIYWTDDGNKPLALGLLENINRKLPVTTVMLTRNPYSCADRIEARIGQPRIFEKTIEQFVCQYLEQIRLRTIPGMRVVNNDLGGGLNDINEAKRRFVAAVAGTGVISRLVMRESLARNIDEADELVGSAFGKWVGTKLWKK